MIILEGTDAVGKTSTIELLKEYKIKDRDKNISKLISFETSLKDRATKLYNYLKNKRDIVIILINNNRLELEKRINNRLIHDEYDQYTYLYNLIYLETYEYMKQFNLLNDKIYLVDVSNCTLEEQVNKVKEVILSTKERLI